MTGSQLSGWRVERTSGKRRWVGWAVLRQLLSTGTVEYVAGVADETQARRLCRLLNRQPQELYWAEYWNTDSTVDQDRWAGEDAGEDRREDATPQPALPPDLERFRNLIAEREQHEPTE